MLGYYLHLAQVSLRRNAQLTILIVLSIALGVAMTMSAYSILYVMSRDPIPTKSDVLYAVQIDNGGPQSRKGGDDEPPSQLTYRDAIALLQAHRSARIAVSHQVSLSVSPPNESVKAFSSFGRATSVDFFSMFDVPMLYGAPWSSKEELSSVVVLSRKMNERLFGGANSVGRTVSIDNASYIVTGVLDLWDPKPRYYDVIGGQNFDEGEDFYLPLQATLDRQMSTSEYEYCDSGPRGESFDDLLRSECVWLQVWVELPKGEKARREYTEFLRSYSQEQTQLGRFSWSPNVRLRNVREWLVARNIVPNDAKLSLLVAASFLIVCLLSASGLLLAKQIARSSEYGVRRALGASAIAIFAQNLVESGLIGVLGGVGGLGATCLSLLALRTLFPDEMSRIAHLDTALCFITFALALACAIAAGLYPAWRAMRARPVDLIRG